MLNFEGHAIVSADGMIAAADGTMPATLHDDADWSIFQSALDAATLVVLGRLGHERHPNPGRRRLVVTSTVSALAPDPVDTRATLWNPAGLASDDVLNRLGIIAGTIAVTGGTRVFDLFLPYYTSFALSEVHRLVLPAGRPAFSSGHPRTALAAHALHPGIAELINDTTGVTLTRWTRQG